MKKLMIAALAAATVGGAFASNVFDYKASVKYVNMKLVNTTFNGVKKSYKVKVVKSTSITGYLVTPVGCPCNLTEANRRAPGFLVVKSSAEKKVNGQILPKIFPANLLTKVWAPKNDGKLTEAEGYLFAGQGKAVGGTLQDGVTVKYAYPYVGFTGNASTAVWEGSPAYDFGDATTRGTYWLFGAYNEQLPSYPKTFVDAWMDAAGFGKAYLRNNEDGTDDEGCVIGSSDTYNTCLKNLSGSVIGGMFTCADNEFGQDSLCQKWTGTSDVISGTWSIKENKKISAATLSDAEIAYGKTIEDGAVDANWKTYVWDTTVNPTLNGYNFATELGYVKACMTAINKNVTTILALDEAFMKKWF